MRKQIAIRVESDFLKQIRIMLAERGITLQDYITDLIKKDMGGCKDENSSDI